jgi:serine/threonine protein kinase
MIPNNLELKAGAVPVPGCRLIKRIGRGGFGEVWEAVNDSDNSKLAIKFLDCNHQFASLIVNEIKLLIQLRELQHPNLLQFYSVTMGPNRVMLTMELAEGSLNDLHYIYKVDHKSHVPPGPLLGLMGQAADGLDFIAKQKIAGANALHNQGMQHCDIKPSNLLLIDNVLKVADFGLSGPQMWNARGKAFGTPPYAPPELYEGRANSRTDQYSLAVTYCELRTGYYPFPIPSDGSPPKTAPDLSLLPEPERPVIAQAMSRQWLNRYASCTDFVRALAQTVDVNEPAIRYVRRSNSTPYGRRFG